MSKEMKKTANGSGSERVLFVTFWIAIFVFRFLFNALFSELEIALYLFKFTTLTALSLLVVVSYKRVIISWKILEQKDQAILLFGIFFMGVNFLRFDAMAVQTAFLFFIMPYLLSVVFTCSSKFVFRLYMITALIPAIEIIGQFVVFNNHILGMGDLWYLDDNAYLRYRSLYTPLNEAIASFRDYGSLIRVDGIFGYNHTTGAYLAVSAAFFFEYAKTKKWVWIPFLIMFIGVCSSTSTTALVALSLAIVSSLVVDKRVALNKRLFLIFLIVGIGAAFILSPIGSYVYDRFVSSSSNSDYVHAFIPDFGGGLDIVSFLIGMSRTGSHSMESDVVRLISSYGVIPVFLVFWAFLKRYFYIKRQYTGPDHTFLRASCTAGATGFVCLLHTSASLGWGVGSAAFFFVGVLIKVSTKRTLARKIRLYHAQSTQTLSHQAGF